LIFEVLTCEIPYRAEGIGQWDLGTHIQSGQRPQMPIGRVLPLQKVNRLDTTLSLASLHAHSLIGVVVGFNGADATLHRSRAYASTIGQRTLQSAQQIAERSSLSDAIERRFF
jgi:hypothetical protein